jgi:hypothetical protein
MIVLGLTSSLTFVHRIAKPDASVVVSLHHRTKQYRRSVVDQNLFVIDEPNFAGKVRVRMTELHQTTIPRLNNFATGARKISSAS